MVGRLCDRICCSPDISLSVVGAVHFPIDGASLHNPVD